MVELLTPCDASKTVTGFKIPEPGKPGNGMLRAEQILGLPVRSKKWNMEITITPEMAADLIKTRTQRPIRKAKIDRFARDMSLDEFPTTHQGIAINEKGQLDDGQHRMLACILSGKPITIKVFFNEPEKNFVHYDRGTARTLADDMSVMDVCEANVAQTLQGAGRILFNLHNGNMPWTRHPPMTAANLLDVTEHHPKLVDTCSMLYRRKGPMPAATSAAFFTLFREVDEDLALNFYVQIRDGEALFSDDPAFVVRKVLIAKSATLNRSIGRDSYMLRLVRAWNHLKAGRKVRRLESGLSEGEAFPKVAGCKSI
jgi:hypothetical protein